MEREIEAYSAALEANDAVEDQMPTPTEPLGEDVAEKIAVLAKEQERMKAALGTARGTWRDAVVAHRS